MTRRKAFTLVELLIVISIICVLMGLLIPAVGAVKESMKRTTCINNQKQLALAVLQFENSFRRFPGYVNSVGNDDTNPPKPVPPGPSPLPASWAVMLFPYIDRADLWSEWVSRPAPDGDLGVNPSLPQYHNHAHIETLICPTNPPTNKLASMWSYAVNGGFVEASGPPAPERIFNGVFFNHWSDAGFNSALMVVTGTGYLTEHDGAANTIMLSENLQQFKSPHAGNPAWGRWTPGPVGWRTLYYDDASDHDTSRGRFCRCIVWFDSAAYPKICHRINTEVDWPFPDADHARPSSLHPQGVVVAFCNGRVKFVKQTIEYNVYKQLMTSYGLHANVDPITAASYDTSNLPLSEADF